MNFEQWNGFKKSVWQDEINLRDFILNNYTYYSGDDSFLAEATPRTKALIERFENLLQVEKELGGVLDIDTTTVTSLTNYTPGYLDKSKELIVGLQTNRPLKRGVNPFGGIRMARSACEAYGYKMSNKISCKHKKSCQCNFFIKHFF